MSRRQFLALALAAAVGGGAFAGVHATYRFEVVVQRPRLAHLRYPLRLALLSDLHYGPFIGLGSLSAWVTASNRVEPDAVLLGGDLVDRAAPSALEPLFEQLARLRAPLGVFAVLGNHDHMRFRRGTGVTNALQLVEALQQAGVHVLHNEGLALRDDLYLAGIDDFREGQPDLRAALAGRPRSSACVLLSHNPDVLPGVPTDVELTLCGHTHGGQVRLPFIGPLVTSSWHGRRFEMGWVEGPARGYVTRGLGVTALPLRIACPAELTVLDLTS